MFSVEKGLGLTSKSFFYFCCAPRPSFSFFGPWRNEGNPPVCTAESPMQCNAHVGHHNGSSLPLVDGFSHHRRPPVIPVGAKAMRSMSGESPGGTLPIPIASDASHSMRAFWFGIWEAALLTDQVTCLCRMGRISTCLHEGTWYTASI